MSHCQQVFRLSPEEGIQRIIHTQEGSEYRREYLLPLGSPVAAKIFVIDDETHSTMLLASEY